MSAVRAAASVHPAPGRRRFLRAAGLGSVGVALGAASFGAACRSPQTRRTGPREVTWPLTIGAVQVSRIVETEAPMAMPAGWFPMATDEGVDAERSWLEPRFIDPERGRLIFAIQTFIVRTGRHAIVVETANGDGNDSDTAEYLTRFRQTGLDPDDVDFVVVTHMHYDHIGWNVRKQAGHTVPTFPRARYLFVREEWEYWRARQPGDFGQEAIQAAVVPIVDAGRADVVGADHRIDEEVELVPLPGHTPGHVAVRVRSQGAEAILGSDVMHHPLSVCLPGLAVELRVDPELARQTRLAFLERYADSGTLIVPAHFPTPAAGRIRRQGRSFRFDSAP